MSIKLIPAYDHHQEIRNLFSEYTQMLVEGDPSFQEYLKIQHYDAELNCPESKYAPPYGRLYIALWNSIPAGCVALRRMDSENCEMKRLFVRSEHRGKGIGGRLVQQIIDDARAIGYKRMLLDTLPFLERAISMYRNLGFREIPIYNDSPMSSVIYMQLDLDTASGTDK